MPRIIIIVPLVLGGLLAAAACDDGKSAASADEKAAEQEAADQKAADEKAAAKAKVDAKAKAEALELERERSEAAFEEAKPALEALAKLPNKRPKGFAQACIDMLAAYEAFMTQGLDDEALTQWTAQHERQLPAMRRACHERPVDAVVCESVVLQEAPPGTELDHVIRVCDDKFSG